MKKFKYLLCIGCLLGLLLTGCEPEGLKDLPAAPENEVSHNDGAGVTMEMPEHEAATTDPAYFDKYGDKENADQVRKETNAGYDKTSGEYGPKDEQARKDGAEIKKGYENAKEHGVTEIKNDQKRLEQEMKDLAESAKEEAKKITEEDTEVNTEE